MARSAGAIWSAQVFRTVFGMPSGPGALWGLSSRSNLATPAVEMVVVGRSRGGRLAVVRLVKTDLNCCRSGFASAVVNELATFLERGYS